MTLPRPCIDCGEPTTATRCEPCGDEHERKRAARNNAGRGATTSELGYDKEWKKLSARARRMTPWCADDHLGPCKGLLAADHLPGAWEKAARGKRLTLLDVEVVCARHNALRGARRRRSDPRGETP